MGIEWKSAFTIDGFRTDNEKDIQLCLTCPYDECSNCLENHPHVPGERPVPKGELKRQEIRSLLLEHKYSISTIARKTSVCYQTVARVEEHMKRAGIL